MVLGVLETTDTCLCKNTWKAPEYGIIGRKSGETCGRGGERREQEALRIRRARSSATGLVAGFGMQRPGALFVILIFTDVISKNCIQTLGIPSLSG